MSVLYCCALVLCVSPCVSCLTNYLDGSVHNVTAVRHLEPARDLFHPAASQLLPLWHGEIFVGWKLDQVRQSANHAVCMRVCACCVRGRVCKREI